MPTTKNSKPHSSTRKQIAAATGSSARAKKAASKNSKSEAKTKKVKNKPESAAQLKKREELTLRAFRMTYESYQRGEFTRL